MIKIIKPKDHKRYKSKIETLQFLFSAYQNIELSPEQKSKATFIIAEDIKEGVYAGGIIYQCPTCEINENLHQIISSLSYKEKKVWTASFFISLGDHNSTVTPEHLEYYLTFYHRLMKKFVQFGKQENINFLVVSIHYADALKTKAYSYWPYLSEVQADDSFDERFHGLLALKSAFYKLTWLEIKAMIQARTQSSTQSKGDDDDFFS